MLVLTDNERGRIQRLNQDKILIEGLKKIFLNAFLKGKYQERDNVPVLAAQRIAIDLLEDGFEELAKIKEEEKRERQEGNPAV